MAEDDLLAAAAGAIVVGIDDSAGARAALTYGIEEASRRQVPVLAVTIHHSQAAWAPRVATVLDERAVGEVRGAAQQFVDEVVDRQRERGVVAPAVRVGIRTGSPSDVLCRLSTRSLLLVIGDRGRGALTSRLIGSVVLGVVVNARCPVLVVHPSDVPDEPRG